MHLKLNYTLMKLPNSATHKTTLHNSNYNNSYPTTWSKPQKTKSKFAYTIMVIKISCLQSGTQNKIPGIVSAYL